MPEDEQLNLADMADEQLRQRIIAGSHSALNLLVARYQPGLSCFIQGYIPSFNSQDVEDVMQETFHRFWKERQRLQKAGNLRSLLWAIAKKVAGSQLRRDQIRAHGQIPTDTLSTMSSAQEAACGQELEQCFQDAMAELTELQRGALLQKLDGYSAREIAGQLGCSPKAVERRLESAAQQLRRRLNIDVSDYSDATPK